MPGPNNNAVSMGNVKWVPALFGVAIQTNALNSAYLEIQANAPLDSISNKKTLTMMCWIYPMEEENFADFFAKGNSNTLQVIRGNTLINYYTGGGGKYMKPLLLFRKTGTGIGTTWWE